MEHPHVRETGHPGSPTAAACLGLGAAPCGDRCLSEAGTGRICPGLGAVGTEEGPRSSSPFPTRHGVLRLTASHGDTHLALTPRTRALLWLPPLIVLLPSHPTWEASCKLQLQRPQETTPDPLRPVCSLPPPLCQGLLQPRKPTHRPHPCLRERPRHSTLLLCPAWLHPQPPAASPYTPEGSTKPGAGGQLSGG